MRLQRYIALSGFASRRKAESLIQDGRVSVNGRVAHIGVSVDETKDVIEIDGVALHLVGQYQYIMLHKPRGYVSTKARFHGQKSVYDLVPHVESLALAGRLDKDSSGLLLMTNDGDLIYQLTHPSFNHSKVYDTLLDRPMSPQEMQRIQKGIRLDEGIARVDAIRQIGKARYRITLHQGWKRQIRRMFSAMGISVQVLQRIRLGKL